ncbi:unnamed protein product [Notodromas monacha]|uniref:Uncharacterized protein n=1 Tax=Notodromas monacha TaxID=399045 RepID=A0A7R9GAV6_9CRUS|nr:unnamed protein product [Notodromas monacha]CAG0915655.1 unnamed protein product [Notodromas monacha]
MMMMACDYELSRQPFYSADGILVVDVKEASCGDGSVVVAWALFATFLVLFILWNSLRQNVLAFLADLFFLLEVEPSRCVRLPGTKQEKIRDPRAGEGIVLLVLLLLLLCPVSLQRAMEYHKEEGNTARLIIFFGAFLNDDDYKKMRKNVNLAHVVKGRVAAAAAEQHADGAKEEQVGLGDGEEEPVALERHLGEEGADGVHNERHEHGGNDVGVAVHDAQVEDPENGHDREEAAELLQRVLDVFAGQQEVGHDKQDGVDEHQGPVDIFQKERKKERKIL